LITALPGFLQQTLSLDVELRRALPGTSGAIAGLWSPVSLHASKCVFA
jgi:hypothetical protein